MVNLSKKAGFTLIELLIVIGILAIIAVAVLATLNPQEAQRKGRDSQRLKQVSELQAIAEQFVADNPTVGRTSTSTAASGSNSCANSGWLGTDVCAYANVLPVHPSNKTTNVMSSDGTTNNALAAYQVLISSGNYSICTRIESKGNVKLLTTDGSANNYFEVF